MAISHKNQDGFPTDSVGESFRIIFIQDWTCASAKHCLRFCREVGSKGGFIEGTKVIGNTFGALKNERYASTTTQYEIWMVSEIKNPAAEFRAGLQGGNARIRAEKLRTRSQREAARAPDMFLSLMEEIYLLVAWYRYLKWLHCRLFFECEFRKGRLNADAQVKTKAACRI